MNKVLLLLFVFVFLGLNAEDSVQAVIFHNDGWKLEQINQVNSAEFNRTINQMTELERTHKCGIFGTAAKLVTEIDKKTNEYSVMVQKMVKFYKQKWNKKHYQNMDDEWKKTTFDRDRKNFNLYYTLVSSLQSAYNDWNSARNTAANSGKGNTAIKEGIDKANKQLEADLKEAKEREKEIYETLKVEIGTARNMK